MSRLLCAVPALLLIIFTQFAIAADRFDVLVKQMPAGANAVMCVDLEAVNESPIAQANGWAGKHAAQYTQKPLVVPPETALLLIGSQLDVQNQLNPIWEMALLELKEHLPLSAIARAEGGRQDSIGEMNMVWSPAGAYFLEIGPTMLGIVSPDDRQFVSRWMKSTSQESSAKPLSDYLMDSLQRLSATRPVVMALDVTDAVQPHRLTSTLNDLETLRSHKDRIPALVPILAGLKGITLEVGLGEQAEGKMTFDFSGNVASLRDLAKPLIIELFDRFDSHLPGLEKWNIHMEPHQIVFSGPLNNVALRRVFSVLEIPGNRFAQSGDESSAESSAAKAAQSSKEYFRAVSTLIDDLQSTLKEGRDNHAVWMERYAKKIDQLPLLGVDPALLDWGANVAETMRTMALAERSAGIRSGVRKSSVYGNYFSYNESNYGSGYSEGGTAATYEQQLGQITTQERAQAKAVRYSSWNSMLDATSKVRRAMTEKYQVEF